MKRLRIALPTMALLVVACGQPAMTTSAMPGNGQVVDAADLLSPSQESALAARLAALEDDGKGPQFVVATTKSLNGKDINRYSIDLARSWGIGSRERNDGILLLVAPNERKVRIEVGTGLEQQLPNDACAAIVERKLLPAFRSGDMATGIQDGVEAIIAQLKLVPLRKAA